MVGLFLFTSPQLRKHLPSDCKFFYVFLIFQNDLPHNNSKSKNRRSWALLHCEMFRATCLAMSWLHCGGTSCTNLFPQSNIVARQVARKVKLNSTFSHGSCNLSCNDFGRCSVCYTVKCFVQLVPP